MRKQKGFTLAEVLVTLTVIGVVAAMTIPGIIQNTMEKQAQTSVKKALSVLSQALAMSIANGDGGADSSSITDSDTLEDLFANYLSTISSSSATATTTDGMIYTFYRGAACTSADNSNCFVEVDINGENGSEVRSTATGPSYNDLYYFRILSDKVIPYTDTTDTDIPANATFGGRATNDVNPGNIAEICLIGSSS